MERRFLAARQGHERVDNPRFHVVAYDYGVKRNILRMIVDRGAR